jgi:acyl-coenzyme A synthetase/AMP-(fatty) acid ligase
MNRRRVLAVALIGAFVVAAQADRAAAQDYDVVTLTGRVLWIAGHMMVVSPYANGAGPVSVDLSEASLDEYMSLAAGDSVTVTGTIPLEGDRVMAISIRNTRAG